MIWVSVGPTRHATFGSTLISIEARPPPISVEARPPLPIRRHVGDGWRGGPMSTPQPRLVAASLALNTT